MKLAPLLVLVAVAAACARGAGAEPATSSPPTSSGRRSALLGRRARARAPPNAGHRGFGLADRKRGVEVTPETVFDVESITKVFTAATVLRLAEEGRLRLDHRLPRTRAEEIVSERQRRLTERPAPRLRSFAVAPEVSVVVESYNHAEGSELERFARSLEAATELVRQHDGEVLVADSSGDRELVELLEHSFPAARRVETYGLGYDRAKLRAAEEARSPFVVFLDGDCVPDPGWLDRHLGALRDGSHGSSGLTRYEGGFMAALETVMDFGFLLPEKPHDLACYASNNTGFRREVLLETPAPEGPMRCNCYAHAQLLQKRGTPVRMTPGARVTHERQAFLPERYRRGFDLVAACWVNPSLPESRLLRLGVAATPFFYLREVVNDQRRLLGGRRELGIRRRQLPLAMLLLPFLRLADLRGIVRALAPGGRESGVGLQSGSERCADP